MKNKDTFLILHNIRSAYNVGAIFRTADAVGVKKIFLCGYTPRPESGNLKNQTSPASPRLGRGLAKLKAKFQHYDKIAKTALGAEKTVPWEYCAQTWRLLEKLNKDNIKIVALEQSPKSQNIFSVQGGSASGGKFNLKFPLALMLGNEVKGLSDKILNYVDDILEIPMHGKKESLNVSVAAGVALYELIK